MEYISLIATMLSLSGAMLNADKRIQGFYVWIVADIMWIFITLFNEMYFLTFVFIIYTIFCFWGIHRRKSEVDVVSKLEQEIELLKIHANICSRHRD